MSIPRNAKGHPSVGQLTTKNSSSLKMQYAGEITEHLSLKQFNKICKYLTKINDAKNHRIYTTDEEDCYSEWEEEECEERQNQIERYTNRIMYLEGEYRKYLASIGLQYGDTTQPEVVFNLISTF